MQAQRYRLPDGTIVEAAPGGGFREVAPQGAAPSVQTRPADPRLPYQVQREQYGAQRDQYQVQQGPSDVARAQAEAARAAAEAERTRATLPADIERARADAARASADALIAQGNLAGGSVDRTRLQRETGMADGNLLALQNQIDAVQGIYERGFRDNDLGSLEALRQYFGTSDTRELDSAAAGLEGPYLSLFRVPGSGTTSDADAARFVQGNTPSSWNFDDTIERKLENLRNRVNSYRQGQGMEPYNWYRDGQGGTNTAVPDVQNSANGTNMSRGVYMPPAAPRREADNTAALRNIEDPVRRGHAMEIAGMMNDAEIGEAEILDYHARNFPGENPTGLRQMLEVRRDPNSNERRAMQQGRKPFAPDPGWFTTQREATGLEQTTGALLDSRAGTAATHYFNSAMGGWLPDAAGLVGVDPETVRAGMEGQRAENPLHALGGDLTGAVGAFGAAGKVARNFNFMQNAPRARMALGDVGYGASYGAGSNPDDRLGGAGAGAMLQFFGGQLGREGTRALGNVARGTTGESAQYLAGRGIPLQPGQTMRESGTFGRMMGDAENVFATVNPFAAPQRRRQMIEFNRAGWNDSLKPIGGSTGTAVGSEAAEGAYRQIGDAYGSALRGTNFTADDAFQSGIEASRANGSRIAVYGDEFDNFVNTNVLGRINPNTPANGTQMQSVLRELNDRIATAGSLPGGREYVNALRGVQREVMGLVRRQNPQAAQGLARANEAFRGYAVTRDASMAARNSAGQEDLGVFTPAQLNSASMNARINYGGRNAAAGTDRAHYDLARHGERILPNTQPDSGTATRQLFAYAPAAAIGGAGAGSDAMGWTEEGAAKAGGLLAMLYGPSALRGVTQRALMSRPASVRNAGEAILNRQFTLPTAIPPLGQRLQGAATPFRDQMTMPQVGGIFGGMGLNSIYGNQSEYRPYDY